MPYDYLLLIYADDAYLLIDAPLLLINAAFACYAMPMIWRVERPRLCSLSRFADMRDASALSAMLCCSLIIAFFAIFSSLRFDVITIISFSIFSIFSFSFDARAAARDDSADARAAQAMRRRVAKDM